MLLQNLELIERIYQFEMVRRLDKQAIKDWIFFISGEEVLG